MLEGFRSLRTTPIPGKLSRNAKTILGALGEFRGILGAALRIQRVILGIRNCILGIAASHNLSNSKKPILGATPGGIPQTDGNPHERFAFGPAFSERFFKNWGGSCASKYSTKLLCKEPELCTVLALNCQKGQHPPGTGAGGVQEPVSHIHFGPRRDTPPRPYSLRATRPTPPPSSRTPECY